MRVLFDSSVLIPALLESLENHEDSASALGRVHCGEVAGVVTAHALAETWSFLSGMPTHPPPDAGAMHGLIREAIVNHFEVVGLDREDYLAVLQEMADRGFRGGVVYDALHIRAARKTAADQILTYDVRDFRRLAPDLADRIRTP